MDKFQSYHLGDDANIVTATVPGEKSKQLLAIQGKLEGSVVSYPRGIPVAFEKGLGSVLEDVDGNRYLDFFSGAAAINLGHSNPDILAAVATQQKNLVHVLDFPTRNKIEFLEKFNTQLPDSMKGKYKVSFGGPTGSDAIEAAIKLARHSTGRSGIIAFYGGYHGMTAGALGATSLMAHKEKLPSVADVQFVPYSYCYRCPFGKTQSSCERECLHFLKNLLENPASGVPKPAAILLEPIQGEGGTVVPHPQFLPEVIKLAHQHDVLVIFDEIQSGYYRTGHLLAAEHWDAVPDIFTLSKGISGIGFPLSALVYKKEIESWGPGFHIGTFRCNQASLAAANATLTFINEHDLSTHVSQMGAYLRSKLETICESLQFVGEIRNQGLFFGIEYVRSVESKEPFTEFVLQLRRRLFENGLLVEVGGHFNNVLRLLPALIVTETIVDHAMEIFQKVNQQLQEEFLTNDEFSTTLH